MLNPTLLDKEKIANAIEKDQINTFKDLMKSFSWKERIKEVESFATRGNSFFKQKNFDNCDSLKYSVVCKSDQVFDYLMNREDVDVNPMGNSYGLPIIQVALHEKNYDYALKILNHPTFDIYVNSHSNCIRVQNLSSLNSEAFDKHLNFIFEFMEKMHVNDFKNDPSLAQSVMKCFLHSKKTYDLINMKFKDICKRDAVDEVNLFDIYKTPLRIGFLAKEIFIKEYKKDFAQYLNKKDLEEILNVALSDPTLLDASFDNENQAQISALIDLFSQEKEKFIELFQNNFSYITALNVSNLEKMISLGVCLDQEKEINKIVITPLEFICICIHESEDYGSHGQEVLEYISKNYGNILIEKLKQRGDDINNYPMARTLIEKENLNNLLPQKEPIYRKIKI